MHKLTCPCQLQSMVWDKPMVWISGFEISMAMADNIWNNNLKCWKLGRATIRALKIWANVLILTKQSYASILIRSRPWPMVRPNRQSPVPYLVPGAAVILMTLLIAAGLNG